MKHHTLIIGAGHSGVTLAASLRTKNWKGPITLIGDENHLPYQRPPLSKKALQNVQFTEPTPLRPEKFYQENFGLLTDLKIFIATAIKVIFPSKKLPYYFFPKAPSKEFKVG